MDQVFLGTGQEAQVRSLGSRKEAEQGRALETLRGDPGSRKNSVGENVCQL